MEEKCCARRITMTEKPIKEDKAADSTELPFVAPCRELPLDAPLTWLRRGWQDFRHAPMPSLVLGMLLLALSYIIAWATWSYGTLALYLGLGSGFVFIGPVLAVGFYSISRRLEAGQTVSLGICLRHGWKPLLRDLIVLGVVILIVLLVWARAASMVHIFFPSEETGDWQALIPFLAVGSVVGALFAAIVFTISAFSLPMLVDRKADSITAVITSVNAVLRNKKPMIIWASIIVACVITGFATALFAFAVLLPIIGHATWHAYRDTIDASAWPSRKNPEDTM